MKKLILAAAIALAAICGANAQSSEKISEILDSKMVTLGQISYLAGAYGYNLPDSSNYTTSFEEMKRRKFLSASSRESDAATLEQASYLFMKATNMDGGLMYKLTDSKRYAFKELKARGMIPQSASPSLPINGHEALDLLNSCIAEAK